MAASASTSTEVQHGFKSGSNSEKVPKKDKFCLKYLLYLPQIRVVEAVEAAEPQVGRLEPQVGPLDPKVGPFESKVGPFEYQVGPFEVQSRPI